MPSVSAIGQKIGTTIANATNSRPAKWLGQKFQQDPESALALATVTSIVLKDGIGCAMYVTQSIHNKKIPDEKRKFVAALDLTNGVLMIAAQIAMFFAMRKYSGPIFEKLFKKSFNNINKSNIISRIRMHSDKAGEAVAKKMKIEKEYNKVKKDALDLFKFVADIAAATIIGKRIIVPLIATPLAKKVEKRMEHGFGMPSDNKDNSQDNKQINPAEQKIESQITANSPEQTIVPNLENNQDTNLLHKFQK